MKISSFLFATAAAIALASAQDAPATTAPAPATTGPAAGPGTVSAPTDAPAGGAATDKPAESVAPDAASKAPNSSSKPAAPKGDGKSPLDGLKPKEYAGQWHMKPVRVVQARVQSDSPSLIKGRFVSSFGKGELEAGYLSGMDGVNTASVEGALMYVQAEGINENSRDKSERCIRKNKMRNIVFYEILIAQTNETLAQFVDSWDGWKAPEYGPYMAFDGGMCTPLKGNVLPPECLQFNGMEQQPNVGPYVGAGFKDLCRACDKKEEGCEVNPNYKFPTLQKAPTPLKPEDTKSSVSDEAKGSSDIVKKKDGAAGGSSGVSSLQFAVASVAASVLAALAL
ncbi:hypothetical protein P43SY_001271 [Pythium insidiosum]|uniref:Uncharacterized protein n=1 Tax=Pythium insidiosum TaxID=114742 RepID=A0AAD5LBP2_PYTIN|nr:hypothetical protein P43SY_001271 [Pythium insidiosum]